MDLARSARDLQRWASTRTTPVATCAVVLLALAAMVAGCAQQQSAAPAVAPVTPQESSESAVPAASDSARQAPPETSVGGADPSGAPSTRPEEIAQDTLTAYANLLTELSADPAGAPVPGSAERLRWDETVDPTSALSREILDRIHRRATVDHVVVQPGAQGVSYRHRVVTVDRAAPSAIEFSWCGWAPGVGRSLVDGAVVDDQVAHATGTGRVELGEGRWRLTDLDQLDMELLPSGAGDPCPDGEGTGG